MKKGQISLFVIIGFVIILFIVMFVLLSARIGLVASERSVNVNQKLDEVQSYVQDCIENTLIQGLQEVGIEGIEEYMKTAKCPGVQDYANGGYEIKEGELKIDTKIEEDQIKINYDYPIEITKEETSTKLNTDYLTYELYTTAEIERGTEVYLQLFGDLGELIIPASTTVNSNTVTMVMEPSRSINSLTDYFSIEGVIFNPYGTVRIFYPQGIQGEYGIVDLSTGITIPTTKAGDYLEGRISSGGNYFVGSCNDFICCWNGVCDQSENVNNCEECITTGVISSGGTRFIAGSQSGTTSGSSSTGTTSGSTGTTQTNPTPTPSPTPSPAPSPSPSPSCNPAACAINPSAPGCPC